MSLHLHLRCLFPGDRLRIKNEPDTILANDRTMLAWVNASLNLFMFASVETYILSTDIAAFRATAITVIAMCILLLVYSLVFYYVSMYSCYLTHVTV